MIRYTRLLCLLGALFIIVGCPEDEPADDDIEHDDERDVAVAALMALGVRQGDA